MPGCCWCRRRKNSYNVSESPYNANSGKFRSSQIYEDNDAPQHTPEKLAKSGSQEVDSGQNERHSSVTEREQPSVNGKPVVTEVVTVKHEDVSVEGNISREVSDDEKETVTEWRQEVVPITEQVEPTPDVAEQTPDVAEQTRDVTEQTHDVTEQTRDVTEQTRDVTEQTPELVEQSPELVEQTPEVVEQTPEVVEQTLEHENQLSATSSRSSVEGENIQSSEVVTKVVTVVTTTHVDNDGDGIPDETITEVIRTETSTTINAMSDEETKSDEEQTIDTPHHTIPTYSVTPPSEPGTPQDSAHSSPEISHRQLEEINAFPVDIGDTGQNTMYESGDAQRDEEEMVPHCVRDNYANETSEETDVVVQTTYEELAKEEDENEINERRLIKPTPSSYSDDDDTGRRASVTSSSHSTPSLHQDD